MNANTYLYQYSDFEDCGLYIGDTGKLACSPSKKLKNVYHLLYTNENLCLAQYNAQHGKVNAARLTISMSIFAKGLMNCMKCWRMKRMYPASIRKERYMTPRNVS